jgi:hypothetical protein
MSRLHSILGDHFHCQGKFDLLTQLFENVEVFSSVISEEMDIEGRSVARKFDAEEHLQTLSKERNLSGVLVSLGVLKAMNEILPCLYLI